MTTWAVAAVLGVMLVLLLVSAAVLFRLIVVRSSGSPALMREQGSGRWRYGSLHYSATAVGYYRLLSLRFRPDIVMPRASLTLGAWRSPEGEELEVAEPGEVILSVVGPDEHSRKLDFDLCLGRGEATALLAWVEACSTDDVRVHVPRTSKRRRR